MEPLVILLFLCEDTDGTLRLSAALGAAGGQRQGRGLPPHLGRCSASVCVCACVSGRAHVHTTEELCADTACLRQRKVLVPRPPSPTALQSQGCSRLGLDCATRGEVVGVSTCISDADCVCFTSRSVKKLI